MSKGLYNHASNEPHPSESTDNLSPQFSPLIHTVIDSEYGKRLKVVVPSVTAVYPLVGLGAYAKNMAQGSSTSPSSFLETLKTGLKKGGIKHIYGATPYAWLKSMTNASICFPLNIAVQTQLKQAETPEPAAILAGSFVSALTETALTLTTEARERKKSSSAPIINTKSLARMAFPMGIRNLTGTAGAFYGSYLIRRLEANGDRPLTTPEKMASSLIAGLVTTLLTVPSDALIPVAAAPSDRSLMGSIKHHVDTHGIKGLTRGAAGRLMVYFPIALAYLYSSHQLTKPQEPSADAPSFCLSSSSVSSQDSPKHR